MKSEIKAYYIDGSDKEYTIVLCIVSDFLLLVRWFIENIKCNENN